MNYDEEYLIPNEKYNDEKFEQGYIPDPSIFNELTKDECFDIFHRKDPLRNLINTNKSQIFILNPFYETQLTDEKPIEDEINHYRFVDIIKIIGDKHRNANYFKKEIELNIHNTLASPSKDILKVIKNKRLNNKHNRSPINPEINMNKRKANSIESSPNFIFKSINEENYLYESDIQAKALDNHLIQNNKNTFLTNLQEKKSTDVVQQIKIKDEIINAIIKEDKYFQCPVESCKRIFKGKYELKNHQAKHHNTEKTFECKYDNCEKKYTSLDSLKKHIKTFHHKKTNIICETCNASFKSYSSNIFTKRI